MIVLKIIGFILLGIFGLIGLALSVKVRIFIEYSEADTNFRLQWLFLKIPVYPNNGKKNKKSASDKKNKSKEAVSDVASENSENQLKEESAVDTIESAVTDTMAEEMTDSSASQENIETPQKAKNNLLRTLYDAHGVDGLMLLVQRVFSYIGTFFGDLMHSLVIDELYLDVMCTKNDAASTAIYYGEVCTALFPMLGALVSKYKVRKYDINVYPDFLAKTSSASFAVSMHLYPIYVVGISFALVFRMLCKVILRLIVKCFLPSKKKVAENNKADSNGAAA